MYATTRGIFYFLILVFGTLFLIVDFAHGECNSGSQYDFKRSDCLEDYLGAQSMDFVDTSDEQPRSGKRDATIQEYRPRAGREDSQEYRPRAGRQTLTRPRAGREFGERPRAGREYTIKITSSELQEFRPRGGRESMERPRAGRENLERPRAGRESFERPRAGRDFDRPRAGRENGERPRAGRQALTRPRGGREFGERPRAGRNVVLVLNDAKAAESDKRGFYLRSNTRAMSLHGNSGNDESVDSGELIDEREAGHGSESMDEKASMFTNGNQPRSGKRELSGRSALAKLFRREAKARRSSMEGFMGSKAGRLSLNDEINNQPRSGKRSVYANKLWMGRPQAGREDATGTKRGFDFPLEEEDGQKLVFLMANKREAGKTDLSSELEKLAGSLHRKRSESA